MKIREFLKRFIFFSCIGIALFYGVNELNKNLYPTFVHGIPMIVGVGLIFGALLAVMAYKGMEEGEKP